jgi:tetratricopeptide (TPR) repeat protein
MINFRRAGWLFLGFIVLLIFPSCAQMKSVFSPQASDEVPQASDEVRSEIRQRMKTGEYSKALDDYKSEYRKSPHDQALLKEYVKSIEDIKAKADRTSDTGNLASAGRIYDTLFKAIPDFRAFAHLLSFDKAQLSTELTKCKTSLSKKGFQEYRKGNLTEAITLWRGCLSIDPTNAEIKQAMNTAMVQQKNLRQK